jgi:hypothetical protein
LFKRCPVTTGRYDLIEEEHMSIGDESALTPECDVILNDPQYLRARVGAVLNEYPELTYYGLGYPNAADDGSYLQVAPHKLAMEQLELYGLARARLCECQVRRYSNCTCKAPMTCELGLALHYLRRCEHISIRSRQLMYSYGAKHRAENLFRDVSTLDDAYVAKKYGSYVSSGSMILASLISGVKIVRRNPKSIQCNLAIRETRVN